MDSEAYILTNLILAQLQFYYQFNQVIPREGVTGDSIPSKRFSTFEQKNCYAMSYQLGCFANVLLLQIIYDINRIRHEFTCSNFTPCHYLR